MFFTIEGIEGSGKSTLINLLFNKLKDNGFKVKQTSEPRGFENDLGVEITNIIKRKDIDGMTEFLLFSSFRNMHTKTIIKPWLDEGNIVLCDRYIHSSIVYQGNVKGVDLKFIDTVNEKVMNGVIPKLVFLIDINPTIAQERLKQRNKVNDKFDEEGMKFHQDVRLAYLELACQNDSFVVIHGDDTSENIVEKMYARIKKIHEG